MAVYVDLCFPPREAGVASRSQGVGVCGDMVWGPHTHTHTHTPACAYSQVFPSEFHLRTLELYLSACATLDDKVDVKNIMSKLMDRLATYAVEHEIPSDNPVFEIFNTQVAKVIKVS